MYMNMGLLYCTKGCTPGGGVRGRGMLEKRGWGSLVRVRLNFFFHRGILSPLWFRGEKHFGM